MSPDCFVTYVPDRSEGRSEAGSPVAWPATTMGDRNDFDGITAKNIYEAERVSRKHAPPRTTTKAGPGLGARRDRFDSPPQLFSEPVRGFGTSRGIPVIRGFRLLRCSRMEPDRP